MEPQNRIFIVAGGSLSDGDFFLSQVRDLCPGMIICADGGASHMEALGLMPQVIVGDLDSLSPADVSRYEAQGCRIIRHPCDKDETDTQLALDYALASRPGEIVIYGALGGRIDHSLANISLLVRSARQGVPARLADEWCDVFVVMDRVSIEGTACQTLSLLPLSATVEGIDLEGFAYPLKGATMQLGAPYGISNRLTGDRGEISLKSGCLLAVRYRRPGIFPGGD